MKLCGLERTSLSAYQQASCDSALQHRYPKQRLAPFGHPANRTRPHLRLLAIDELHGPECHRRIRQRHEERHPSIDHTATKPRGMQNPAIHWMRRDVVLAGDIELPRAIGYDLLMDVAICAADVHVRAGVVGNPAGIHTAPGAGHPTTLEAGGQL